MFDGQLNSFDMCSMVISGTDWFEVPIPYIFGLFFRPICNGEYPHKSYSQKYGTFTYLHVLDPEDLPLLKNRLNIYGRYLFWPVNDGYMMVIYVICVYIYIYSILFLVLLMIFVGSPSLAICRHPRWMGFSGNKIYPTHIPCFREYLCSKNGNYRGCCICWTNPVLKIISLNLIYI